MLLPIQLKFNIYIHKDDLQPLYESLLAIKNISQKHDQDSGPFALDEFMGEIQNKIHYLKYREAEIEDRLRQEKEEKEIRDATKESTSKP